MRVSAGQVAKGCVDPHPIEMSSTQPTGAYREDGHNLFLMSQHSFP